MARPRGSPRLTTVYVRGVPRDVRAKDLRALLAALAGVSTTAVVDVDRFGALTAVTVLADAAEAFVNGVASPSAEGVLEVVYDVDPWAVGGLGGRRRGQLTAAAAADTAADFCRRRLETKLSQLERRGAMPPPLREALRRHVRGMLTPRARPLGREAGEPAPGADG